MLLMLFVLREELPDPTESGKLIFRHYHIYPHTTVNTSYNVI